MKRKRHSTDEIIRKLREAEALEAQGQGVAQVCQRLEISERVLAELFAVRGVPRHIRSDNGPEFIAHAVRSWLETNHVGPLYIEPGAPWENGVGESFNGKLRDECLSVCSTVLLTTSSRCDFTFSASTVIACSIAACVLSPTLLQALSLALPESPDTLCMGSPIERGV